MQTVLRKHLADAGHVGVEAHGEHLVGFVEDEVAHGTGSEVALLEHVDHASGSADHEMCVLEAFDLLLVADAAIDDDGFHTLVGAEDLGFLGHLQREFARGDQDEGLRGVVFPLRRFRREES